MVSAAAAPTSATATYEPVVGANRYSPWLKTTGERLEEKPEDGVEHGILRILLRPQATEPQGTD